MDEQTTTDAPVQDTGVTQEVTQPEEQHAEAVQTTDSEPTTTNDEQSANDEPAQADNSDDVDITEWANKKGYDLSTAEGQAKALKSLREAETRMHQATQRSSELEKQLQGTAYEQVSDDPTAQRALETAASVQLELQVERWKSANNVTPEQDQAIGAYLSANQDKAYMLKNGYLSLDDIAAMSGALKQDTAALKSQGSRETLEKLANKQVASSVPGNAVSTAPPAALTAANAEAWWDSIGPEGRANPENRAKLDSVLG